MTENQYPDLFGESARVASRDFQQMFYAAAALAAAYLRYRSKTQQRKAIKSERDRRAAEAQEKAERDAVRARWEPATDRRRARTANAVEVAEAWGAAVPYADPGSDLYERSAAWAVDNCEARLRELHPYAMNHYDRLRADGLARQEAMHATAPLFMNHPNARPHGSDERLGLAAVRSPGPAQPGADEIHGPSREEFEQHAAQQARGARIVDRMQSRALAADRPPLDPDEQRTALANATNLPDEVIGQVVRPGPAPTRPPRRPWENESPFSIEEVVAFAAAHPQALVHPAPAPHDGRQPTRTRHV